MEARISYYRLAFWVFPLARLLTFCAVSRFQFMPNWLAILFGAAIVNTAVLLVLWWLQTSDFVRLIVYLSGVTLGGLIGMAWDNHLGFAHGMIGWPLFFDIVGKTILSWLGAGAIVFGLVALKRSRRSHLESSVFVGI